MSQKLFLSGSEWVENASQFTKNFIDNCNKNSDKGYFLEVYVQCPEKLHDLHNDLSFLSERMKIEKVEKLVTNSHTQKRICCTHTEFKTSIKSWISIEKST